MMNDENRPVFLSLLCMIRRLFDMNVLYEYGRMNDKKQICLFSSFIIHNSQFN